MLYDVIKSKRHRAWQKIHEPIMMLYLELCVDLKKSHVAKEGLYQYKNICQNVILCCCYFCEGYHSYVNQCLFRFQTGLYVM